MELIIHRTRVYYDINMEGGKQKAFEKYVKCVLENSNQLIFDKVETTNYVDCYIDDDGDAMLEIKPPMIKLLEESKGHERRD